MIKSIHTILTFLIAIFFIYKGIDKMPIKISEISQQELKQLSDNDYLTSNPGEKPVGYKVTMNTMSSSGFIKMIGVFQILSGILMIIPITRIIGTFLLLPIIFNILMMHIYFDNRVDENILCGVLLLVNLFLCSYYYSSIKKVILDATTKISFK